MSTANPSYSRTDLWKCPEIGIFFAYVNHEQNQGALALNANQIINMIMRVFLHRIVSFGIDKGVNSLSGVGRGTRKSSGRPDEPGAGDEGREPTQAERRQQRQARKMASQARQMSRLTRKL